jgi:hypothetical protein
VTQIIKPLSSKHETLSSILSIIKNQKPNKPYILLNNQYALKKMRDKKLKQVLSWDGYQWEEGR